MLSRWYQTTILIYPENFQADFYCADTLLPLRYVSQIWFMKTILLAAVVQQVSVGACDSLVGYLIITKLSVGVAP